jgi:transcriptional regulator with XRE-family HTH domain
MIDLPGLPITPPPVIHMHPEEMFAWRMVHGYSKRDAAAALGLARNTLRAYESGRYPIPRYVALACQAITTRRELTKQVAA